MTSSESESSTPSLLRDPWTWVFALLPLALGLHFVGVDFFYPDEPRHAMNGALLRELLTTMPADPMGAALEFYARYPAISLGYHPPGLPVVEALFFLVFGLSTPAAHAAVWSLSMAAGVVWFRALTRLFDRPTAVFGGLIFWSMPTVFKWNAAVMLELPTLAFLIFATYCVVRRIQGGGVSWFFAAVVIGAAAAYMKQTAGVWMAGLGLFLLVDLRASVFRQAHVYAGAALYVALLVPLILLTRKFGGANAGNTVGDWGGYSLTSLKNWTYYLAQVPGQVSPLWALFAFVGVALSFGGTRGRECRLFLCWVVVNYLLMSLVSYKSPRLGMLWCPALAGLAAHGFRRFWQLTAPEWVIGLLAALCAFALVVSRPVDRVAGFQPAVDFVQANWKGDTMLYDGYQNGTFVFRMAAADRERRRIVLRGSKVLSSTMVMPQAGVTEEVHDAEGILALLRNYRTGLIVVEEENTLELRMSGVLRDLLRSRKDLFEKVAEFPIAAEGPDARLRTNLLVYRFRETLPPRPAGTVRLRMRTLGDRIIELPLK